MASNPVAWLLQLPFMVAIGLGHIAMCQNKEDEIITVVEIIRNVPTALRHALGRLRPFLK